MARYFAVSVELRENGVTIPGTVRSTYQATAGEPVTLPIDTTIRKCCGCCDVSTITAVLTAGDGNVTNFALRVVKE